jgi:superfamily II DNA or RNA helicase
MGNDNVINDDITRKPTVIYNPYKRAKFSNTSFGGRVPNSTTTTLQGQQQPVKQQVVSIAHGSLVERSGCIRNGSYPIQQSVDDERKHQPLNTLVAQSSSNEVTAEGVSESIEEYDDGGIDWASIPEYSFTASIHQHQQKQQQQAIGNNTVSDSNPSGATASFLSSSVASAPSRCVTVTAPTPTPGSKLQAMESSSSFSKTRNHKYLSSIQLPRPTEWKHPNNLNTHQSGVLSTSSPSKVIATVTQGNHLPNLPPELSYDLSRIQPVAVDSEEHRQLVKNANLSEPLKNGWTLMPHQKNAVLQGLQIRRLVVAFDMGLGKTALACVWANAFQKTFVQLKVYVVAPVSLQKEWKNTASTCTDLVMKEDDNLYGLEVASWGKVPSAPSYPFVVIADEAHSMQSITSQRTKDMLLLLGDKNCVGCLLLTGTPMKNGKPANLFPLLKGVRHPLGDNQRAYEIHFCNGHSKNFGKKGVIWDATGSSNLDQLRAHIASHVIHMSKEDCLEGLPGKTREYRQIQVSSKFEYRYQAQLKELAAAVQTSAASSNVEDSDAILGAFTRVRQISSFSKIDATVSLARSILEKEPAIVIFTCFVDVAKSVHQKLVECGWSGELLTGQTPGHKRQEMVDNFQAGLSSVFISTFGAGGVGLTLTAACTIILLDRPWTPGEPLLCVVRMRHALNIYIPAFADPNASFSQSTLPLTLASVGEALQAEDRVRRIGQKREVKSIWMRAFDIDKQIDEMIEQKNNNSHAVVDGRVSSNNSSNVTKISIFQLVASLVPKVEATSVETSTSSTLNISYNTGK